MNPVKSIRSRNCRIIKVSGTNNNHSNRRGNNMNGKVVIYYAFCSDVAPGHMNRAPNETRTHLRRFANSRCPEIEKQFVLTYINIGKYFLNLLDRHFNKNNLLSNNFLNKNTVKISYFCKNNMYKIVNNHNKRLFDALRIMRGWMECPFTIEEKMSALWMDNVTRKT